MIHYGVNDDGCYGVNNDGYYGVDGVLYNVKGFRLNVLAQFSHVTFQWVNITINPC